MPDTEFQKITVAAKQAGLHIEGLEILFSEDQGTPAKDALVCVDRWLAFRDGAIRMQVRVLARESTEQSWECVFEGGFSDPLTFEQAAGLVAHWGQLQAEAGHRWARKHAQETAAVEAFGGLRPRG